MFTKNLTAKLLLLSFFIILCSNNCKKAPPLGDFYFRCKVDGHDYIPNNCANCTQCDFLGDTTLILGGNRGFETLGIGLNDVSGIKPATYDLNNVLGRRGDYKNSTLVDDRYFTDSTRTGEIIINSIDINNKVISGTFYFKAYNAFRADSVNVTDGKFRLQYNNH
jgi:hypothetical protein